MIQFFFIFIVFFSSTKISTDDVHTYFIVWNIGQGQWITLVTPIECIHFDMGGEHFPMSKIKHYCMSKKNYTYLSHSDWDHINGLKKWQNTCLMNRPWAKTNSNNEKLLNRVHLCEEQPQVGEEIVILNQFQNAKMNKKNLNDSSQVVYLKKWKILIPGDSTIKAEKIWTKNKIIENANLLILGHHGSQTSTSNLLLEKARNLKNAVVSARLKKYGHPHQVVIDRLKKYKINILTTEKFGNLIFQLN